VLGRMEEHQHKKTSRLRKLRVSNTNESHLPRANSLPGVAEDQLPVVPSVPGYVDRTRAIK